jgi:ATP-dependent helicase HrpA
MAHKAAKTANARRSMGISIVLDRHSIIEAQYNGARSPSSMQNSTATHSTESRRQDLLRRLREGMSADWQRLSADIRRLRGGNDEAQWARIARAVEASVARCAARVAGLPRPHFPPELPVSQRWEDIGRTITEHQVVIVSGETGSGKTTQLPKICLALGRGARGLIGHTQPRRIAARAVATRIAQELGTVLGQQVGYKVRFTDRTGHDAYIKLMTDGILLAETRGDRSLAAYDTLIIDEAHERSLNIDFMLGYLKQLLPRRPDLKVIITSATIDAARFADHFAHAGKPAPVLEVSGRLYPVDVRYRPVQDPHDDDEREMEDAIVDAVAECRRLGSGDILVFLPGEREIRETADLLRADMLRHRQGGPAEILPLYARLSADEQQRVFECGPARRIILATNVAETSLTVPGIRFVVDTGLARVNRYSVRNKVQLLQIEKISQAAANQRAGRCGRVADGICLRLYDEADFTGRPPYTDPEILRSSLASVILRMSDLGLGDIEAFPFLQPPTPRAVADGFQLLQELGAVDSSNALTGLGRELAGLPIDPRVGRMILAAREHGCIDEVLTIAAALSVPDPRERPLEKQQAADQSHLRFRDERSDFLSFLHLWDFFAEARTQEKSQRKLVAHCRSHFLSYLRLREWADIRSQLAEQAREIGLRTGDEPPPRPTAGKQYDAWYERVHKALLTGLLGNIGLRGEEGDFYQGARGIRFHLHPASGIERKKAKWIMAAELAETTRLYARCAAQVEPAWIEAIAGERCQKAYFDPRWEKARGEVVASERVSLYGLTLVARRPVSYAAVNAPEAREIFIRSALVQGDFETRAAFFGHNRQMLAEVAELEHKARRQDVLVDDETLFAFYAERLPPEVVSAAGFEAWRRKAEAGDPQILFMTRELLMRHAAQNVTEEQFPEAMQLAGVSVPLKYRFDPGHPRDGVTLTLPLALLNQLDEKRIDWLVPGMIREKIAWAIKALPKAWRSRLVPHAETVTDFLEAVEAGGEPLLAALRDYLGRRLGERPPADAWHGAEPPAHLIMNLRVVDDAGTELAMGRDLGRLRDELGHAARLTFVASDPGVEREGLTRWDFGELPEKIVFNRQEGAVAVALTGYPALVDAGDSVSVRLFDQRDAAERAMREGVHKLLALQLKPQLKQIEKGPPGFLQAALQLRSACPTERLLADVLAAIQDRALIGDDCVPRNERAFAQQKERGRARLPAVSESAGRMLVAIAGEYHLLAAALSALPASAGRLASDLSEQRAALIHPGFFATTPWDQLAQLPRYLEAMRRRTVKYRENPERDVRHAQTLRQWTQRYAQERERRRTDNLPQHNLEQFRWMLEELRVSLFAQELKTPYPVSLKRLEKAWKTVVNV